MASRRKSIFWVVMGPEPALASCIGCGDVLAPPSAFKPLDAFARWLKAFEQLHRDCDENGENVCRSPACRQMTGAPHCHVETRDLLVRAELWPADQADQERLRRAMRAFVERGPEYP